MSVLRRVIAVLAVAVFLLGCAYVGYINEQLKGAIAPADRAILMMGFVLGVGAVSRYLLDIASKRVTQRQERRR